MKKYPGALNRAAVFCAGILVSVSANSAPLQTISEINPALAPGTGGGDSFGSIATPDGRFVVFASSANNLATTSSNTPFAAPIPAPLNVFLRSRTNGTTTLVSLNLAGSGGGNGDSVPTGISTNGRYVLFESRASDLEPNDTNAVTDIFVRDLSSGTTTLVSVNTSGAVGNGTSVQSSMSADGQRVVFVSAASDLVGDDTNRIDDVFVRDLQSNTTVRVSADTLNMLLPAAFASKKLAGCASPDITPDGRYVSFLARFSGSPTIEAVFVADLFNGVTILANSNSVQSSLSPAMPEFSSDDHGLSDNGRFVVFEQDYSNTSTIKRFDRQTGFTDTVNSESPANSLILNFRRLDMTPDGRFVAYVSHTNSGSCIYLWDAQSGSAILASAGEGGASAAGSICDFPAVSPSGRYVAFLCNATNLTTNTVSGEFHLYVYDAQNGSTRLVDADPNGVGKAKDFLSAPRFAGDGLLVFDCTDGDLVTDDSNRAYDVFACGTETGSIELISARAMTLPSKTPSSTGPIWDVSVDTAGRYVAFASPAPNLAPSAIAGDKNIFVHDLATDTNVLASVSTNGLDPANADCAESVISGDGRYVAFASAADNLVPEDTNNLSDVFIRDLQTGTTTLVSSGAPAGKSSHSPVLSANGQFVLFRSPVNAATDNLYLWDRDSQTAHLLSGGATFAAMTPDGHYVAFIGPSLYLWNSIQSTSTYIGGASGASRLAVSPDGGRIVYAGSTGIKVVDCATKLTQTISSHPLYGAHPGLNFSGDGRFLVYATTGAEAAADKNYISDVYLYDFSTGTNLLISHSRDSDAAADGASDSPVISTDGRFIAFRSAATNLVSGVTNGMANVFLYDRHDGSTVLLSAGGASGGPANSPSLLPVFSGDGETIVFQSWASDLSDDDFNQAGDLFAVKIAVSNPSPVFAGRILYVPDSNQPPTLTWPAEAGMSYRGEFKDDLSDAAWSDLTGAVWTVGNRGYATDEAWNSGHRFYRVVSF